MLMYQPWKRWKQNVDEEKNNENDTAERCEQNLIFGLPRQEEEEKK